ncbi:MAG: GMC family oxidoreductase N-terminal domain-containing protein [Rhodospirillaceae bacterium]|jgi:choline dehydrogenase|nr:GMC family oxidoreductase N-terminal domain-containing protein [Rhodospirillaceae bacterium]
MTQPTLGTFDYVIVGGGTAGCLLANRLSADPDVTVLLLEAGGKDDYLWIHVPVGYLYCMGNPRTDWCFKTEAEPGLGGRAINYPRGRVLGGCSSINGMIYMRGQARDYDHWRQLGNTGWGWDDVLPYFKQHEDFVHGADEMHGAKGEWRIDRQRLHWPILDDFRDAANAAGLPKVTDFNRGDNHGVGYFHVTQRGGIRLNTAKAFLNKVRHRRNLRIVTGAQAKRVLVENRRAVGVEVRVNGADRIAQVRGEVILAAGAIGSPHLLELSGIGRPEHLRTLGIDVVHALSGLGENLQDHLQLRLIYKLKHALTLNTLSASLLGKARIGLEYLLKRSGPMSMAPSQLGAFAKSDPSLETPDLEYHVQPLSLDRFGEPLHPFPAITASVCNLRPESRGSVHAATPNFTDAPAIRPNYLSTAGDRRVAAAAIRLTRGIMRQAPMAAHEPEEYRPGPAFQSDEELTQAAGQIGTTIFHPVGTAKMGGDEHAVVDARLRVHGIEGLRIIDASVMPTITSGNTNAPVLMIAEKGAAMMREDRR